MMSPILEKQDFTGGVNSKQRPSKIAENELVSIVGMDFVANTLQRAKGYTKLGTEDDSTLTGKSLYNHRILAGTEVLIKQIGTYLKFYDTVDEEWHLLTASTVTTAYRWHFESFNGYLYGVNGIDNWIFWNGGARSTLATAVGLADVTITLATGEGARFAAGGGTVMIEGDQITYTAVSTDTLTGVSGITATHAAGKTVIQELDATTYSGLTKAQTIKFFKNRLYAVDYATPNILRHSKLADNTTSQTDLINFTGAGSGSGDAGYGIAPDKIVAIHPLVNSGSTSVMAVFCEDGIVYHFEVTDGASTTTNAFIPLRTMGTYPIAPQMVTVAENDLIFVDYLGHVRALFYGDTATPLQVETRGNKIEPSLELVNFADGTIKYHKRKLYVAGMTADSETPDVVFYSDANYKGAWGSYEHLDVSALEIYNNELVGLSAVTGNVWTLNSGYSVYVDDEAENNEGTYRSEFTLKEISSNISYITALKIRMRGFITNNCEAVFKMFLDGASTATFSWTIEGDNTNIVGSLPNVAVGSVVFGKGVVGGGLPDGTDRREFFAELLVNDLTPFLTCDLQCVIDDKNVDFEAEEIILWADKNDKIWKDAKILSV